MTVTALPARAARAEQHATRAAFFLPGFATAAWAPLVPFAKTRTGLDEGTLGLVLLCLGAGSLLAMPLAGILAARHGCRAVMIVTLLMVMASLPLLAIAPSPWTLGLALFVFGAGVGACDCTMNIQAVMVERDSGRPMMSGFHAFYSIGGAVGAAAMTVLLSLRLPPLWVCVLASITMVVVLAVSVPYWRRDRAPSGAPLFAVPHGVVLAIGVLCFVAFLAEGAMLDWSAVFLHEVQQVPPDRAGLGFMTFAIAMTVTRLVGDGVVAKLGRLRAILLGSIVAAAGFGIATFASALLPALAGYALIGLGCANIVPALFSMAGNQKAMPESLAIPAITTLGYAGVLAGPALIGFVAQGSSLVVAFCAVAAALLLVGVSARWVRA
ncbi:MFS transporter [Stenotrophomonas sp.]|uniref:MFS transporter n=1 Tax=Stenotrophomonas sp. TaxID=69392 RepID=UPI0028AB77C7|nr:MFS transporter [Stenotrophomonas sp.]